MRRIREELSQLASSFGTVSIGARLVRRNVERTTTMPTQLLNDDGTASMATMIMCSHHAFRRDIASFARALAPTGDSARYSAVADEWRNFRAALHGYHEVEDTAMFPSLRTEHPEIAAT